MYNTMMKAKWRKEALFIFIFISRFYNSNGCWMEDVDSWFFPEETRILDIHRGIIFDRVTRDIINIVSHDFSDELNGGPYFTVSHTDSRFVIATNDAFENYERYETFVSPSIDVTFRCSDGTTNSLVFIIGIQDTNNHSPEFLESNKLAYNIMTPLAPGVLITGCSEGITVRDIDLTTSRIDFTIEENSYFEIEYDNDLSTTAKEFTAILRTTAFIRSLSEPMVLEITATDVDGTGDPRRNTTTTITISANTEFELPEELVFTKAFYLANYTDDDDNQLVLLQPISLQSGFDNLVQFSLEKTDFSDYFEPIPNGNQVSIRVIDLLPPNVLRENQIVLVVRAYREYTSGASATIIVQLPEEVPLEFAKLHYEGTIDNNNLTLPELTLSRGYEGETVNVEVFGEYESYFDANIDANTITLSMEQLAESIINENNVISLEVVASTEFSYARAVVTLEIIKDDNVTPVFNKAIYTGSYHTETGLTIDKIELDQGYDDTVELVLEGDEFTLFTTTREGPIVTLSVTNIPSDLFYLQRIRLILQATKPRTVGANAVIDIALPAARELGFEKNTYRGTLKDNILSLEPIILSTGYDETVVFSIRGDLREYFNLTFEQNKMELNLMTSIPTNIIQENNIIVLNIEASGPHAVMTTTTILLDILKEDITTPMFTHNIYYGIYQGASRFNIETINLAQGFSDDVVFELRGEHAEYFNISNTDNNVEVSLRATTIPEDVIFTEKVLLFNIIAIKPLTVGANAAISIRFPSELTDPVVMRFAENTYEAAIENNKLTVDDIILIAGFAPGTQFLLTEGDFSTYFNVTNTNNVVSLSLIDTLPIDEIESTFIVLDLEARRETAVSVWTSIVIDIVRQEIEPLVFTHPYYRGVYSEETETLSFEMISLALGFDDTVDFYLEGDFAPWFNLTGTANTLSVATNGALSSDVLEKNSHLMLAIMASKPNAIEARAAILINIEKQFSADPILSFDKVTYVGSIENTTLALETITLIKGYSETVTFSLHGALNSFFNASSQGNGAVSVTLTTPIPNDLLPSNRIIVLEIRARADETHPAHATIVLEVIVEDEQSSAPRLEFDASFYTGSYTTAETGITMDRPIILAEGFDESVTFDVEGDQSEWFTAVGTGNSVSLIVSTTIPGGILVGNQPLVFVVTADRPGSDTARATIVISLTDEFSADHILSFDKVTYVGSIENTTLALETITLIEGYSETVTFSLHGALNSFFNASSQGNGAVSVTLTTPIPNDLLPSNRIIVLEIRARADETHPAHATIVLEVIVEDEQSSAPRLEFDASFYTGSYTTAGTGITMDRPIILAEGFDESVTFDVEGDQSEWFTAVGTGNSVSLIVSTTIPGGILVGNQPLVFVVTADRPGSDTARATIVISLTDEFSADHILSFDKVTYVGSIENTTLALETITLIEGYSETVTFSLHGTLNSFFNASSQGNGAVSVTLTTPIPNDLLPSNRIIVLEIRARADETHPAHATIVLEVIVEDEQSSAPRLEFDASFYTGSYTTAGTGITMDRPIILAEGFDESVTFDVEGDQSEWFTAVGTGNSVSLIVSTTIPGGILVGNQPLVFVVTADRPGSDTARATIVISLTDEFSADHILSFDKVTYVGSIENTTLALETITLIEGYSETVTFSLHGALNSFFNASSQGNGAVSVTLTTPIPNDLLPSNRIIVLEIRARADETHPAHATIVLEVIVEDEQSSAPRLEFDASFYTGSYTTAGTGITMDRPIILAEGFDESVTFDVEGDQSEWFTAVGTGNSVSLIVSTTIPGGILVGNQPLVFVVTADRPGSDTARATIVISLTDEFSADHILSFDKVTYVGSIENTTLALETITLIEGYSETVTFSLHGALNSFFNASSQGNGAVSVTLTTPIPNDLLPSNRIIVLEIRARADETHPAHATIVLEVIVEDEQSSAPRLEFDASFYTGSYTTAETGITMDRPIILAEGFDESVTFDVEGDQSEWFAAVGTGNSVSLVVSTTIPGGVLVGNQPLVFVVTADRPGSDTARATIVISLTDEFSADPILSFDKVTYIGSIENTSLALETITLIKGYSETVTFSLHGALNSFFNASSQGNGAVSVTLTTPIPNDLLPSNRIIVLEIRARADETHPAHATIVLEVIVEDEQSSAPRLEFDASFYTGSYTTAGTGITMDRPIILAEGFDESVTFDVEGDQSEWFTAVGTGNSVSLIVSTTIPGGILVGNQPLVFVVTADRPGSDTARATIVISLTDEFSADHILSFDKVTYVGSIENTTLALETITLIEGYSETVTFSLHGALNSFFNASSQGNGAVSVTLTTPIPNDLLPSNRIIVLEIRARADETHPAHATIVLEVIVEDEQSSAPRLEFDASFYTGSYTTAGTGITMDRPIILAEGFDESVTFDVEGDQSEWFTAVGTGNSVSLIVSTTIPGGILVGNQPLVFVVTADRPGSDTARATIVISLTDEFSADHILSFDKVTYVGSIENTTLALETITLIEGYSETVTFSLHGALNSFFNASSQGNGAVSVTLTTPIPNDLLPSNRIIVLEIRARADETHPAHATIVLEVIVEDEQSSAPRLEFDASFYTGSYTTAETGITMDRPIILAEGFDESVTFDVEGDQSEWFTAVGTGNSVSLIVSTTIPGGILVGNQPLVFVVTADRPGSDTARATIVISLTDEFSADHILSFDKVTYVGSIENTTLALETITLIEGYSETVTFSLHGALNSFFNASSQGNGAVSVTLTTPIPNDLLPSNRIIILEIRARADETHPAHATIVLEVIVEDEQSSAPRLEFDASFYTGSYTTAGTGITMDRPIILAEGFDESVTFDVEGDQSEWFTAVGTGNSVSLIVSTTIPGGILVGNQPLVFVVTADRPGSDTARATIVISLTDEFSADHILSFDKVTYVGSIENTTLALETITLIEGYSETVTFSLHGALNSFFNASSQGNGAVSVTLTSPIPNDLLPSNRIIILEIRARAVETHPAHATIVLEVIVEDEQSSAPRLEFDASFYTGSYTTAGTGITMDRPIILAEGFDESVTFDVEGDQSEWFTAVGTGNSVSLIVSTTIPGGILVGNQPLVFVVTADRPGSDTARATIVISLTDEFSADHILSFDKVTYVGSIENTTLALETITLIEGYSETVTFSLHGALNSFFNASSQGNGAVSVTLTTPIPNDLLPSNRIIVLEIRARADETHPAHATIVLEVIVEDEQSSAPRLEFDASFYTGSYTTAETGITMDRPIILAEGFDESVTFDVEGDQSEWFTAVGTGNSVSLIVSTTIPGGILVGNQPLVFVVTADRPGSDTARATIVISLTDEFSADHILSFDKVTYVGSIENTTLALETITLIKGYSETVTFSLHGALNSFFNASSQGNGAVSVTLTTPIPNDLLPSNRIIVLEIRARADETHPAHATIVLEVIVEDEQSSAPRLEFDASFYTGSYTTAGTGITMDRPIILAEGFDESVTFDVEGDQSEWFTAVGTGNSVSLIVSTTIPGGILVGNQPLVFVVTADRPGSDTARATIVISLTDEFSADPILSFDKVTYVGSIENTTLALETITLIEGYSETVTFSLHGALNSFFNASSQGNGAVSVTLTTPIPNDLLPSNRIIVLEIRARADETHPAHATIVLEVIVEDEQSSAPRLEFDASFYTGSYTTAETGITMDRPIILAEGFDESVTFDVEGDQSEWFTAVGTGNSVSLVVSTTIPGGVLVGNQPLVFVVTADRPGSDTARATIVISLTDEFSADPILSFDKVTYIGSIENTSLALETITLIEGYSETVTFSLHGALNSFFNASSQGNGAVSVTLTTPIPNNLLPSNRIIVLEIRARADETHPAHATIVLEVIVEDEHSSTPRLVFDASFYTGSYTTAEAGITLDRPIILAEGFDESVTFDVEGDQSEWFTAVGTGNSVSLVVSTTIPGGVLVGNQPLVFVVTADRPGSDTARATIVISLENNLQPGDDVSFEKLVYEGIIQLNTVQHELIIISNYDGVIVNAHGVFSDLFVTRVADGVVTVQASGSLTLPGDVTTVVLELHAADARSVLLLTVEASDVPVMPAVTFSSPSYVLNVEIVQTGLVGRVSATADNGEAVSYSLAIENAHLQARISINNEGELYLSAPANSGIYTFQVIASTVITQTEGRAQVHLTVNAVTVCGDEIVVPPLIILDRNEEEPHNNLVTLSQFENCHFSLTNRWPLNQNWLYVDENGLHARTIDREHESIAYMAQSQVQVELILHCENDNVSRTKRSERTDWLGPYDYGSNQWILTESISYNSRRSFVNLIVNDINDNIPIFVGKEREPIAVGYPIGEIEDRILPRSLAELQATDADVGENAALRYWSSEEVLAVAPSTGFVHVRNSAQLENDQSLIISATDQNGQGLTGHIQLVVKLLDFDNIVVVTVRDAFQHDETTILAQLSEAVGYEMKALKSIVISDNLDRDDDDDDISRKKRETGTSGASLLLYVYGLLQREPVSVDRLTVDINNAAVVSVISTVSLEDHLEPVEIIISESNIGLLVATIVLSVLLFITLVLIAVWFFLRWRKNNNYKAFSDISSLASRTESEEQIPNTETPKPRLNFEELKRSERRLQNMLNAPIEEVTVEAVSPRREIPVESIVDLLSPESNVPIVIQSIDKLKSSDDSDDDEFGEKPAVRRKSVVTFNENVEKIIHVEDDDADTVSSVSSYETYKF